MSLQKEQYTICFQSRLGKEPWIKPYTQDTIIGLAQRGAKKILVFSPSFVADCLETLYEIAVEYKTEFVHHGGKQLDLVESLNASAPWVDALHSIIHA